MNEVKDVVKVTLTFPGDGNVHICNDNVKGRIHEFNPEKDFITGAVMPCATPYAATDMGQLLSQMHVPQDHKAFDIVLYPGTMKHNIQTHTWTIDATVKFCGPMGKTAAEMYATGNAYFYACALIVRECQTEFPYADVSRKRYKQVILFRWDMSVKPEHERSNK